LELMREEQMEEDARCADESGQNDHPGGSSNALPFGPSRLSSLKVGRPGERTRYERDEN
jgi:hypothetical protein